MAVLQRRAPVLRHGRRDRQRPVGVFLAYTADQGTACIDRALSLPRAWADDRERRSAAGIPTGARFVTKVALARRLLTRAFAAGVPARWAVADSFYGRSHAFRRWLEQRGRAYVLMVPKTTAIEYQGHRERAGSMPYIPPDRQAHAAQPPPAVARLLTEAGLEPVFGQFKERRGYATSCCAAWRKCGPSGRCGD